jgi:hypothetical protein
MNSSPIKSILFRAALSALALGTLGIGGCVYQQPGYVAAPPPPPPAPVGEVVVTNAPPPDQVEVVGVAPGPNYYWVNGYYVWDGGRYAWRRGYWAPRPWGSAYWVAGHWEHRPRGWFYVGGYWR